MYLTYAYKYNLKFLMEEFIKDIIENLEVKHDNIYLKAYYIKTLDYYKEYRDNIDKSNVNINEFINLLNHYTKNYFGFKFLYQGKFGVFLIPYDTNDNLFMFDQGSYTRVVMDLQIEIQRRLQNNKFSEKFSQNSLNKNYLLIQHMDWWIISDINEMSNINLGTPEVQ